MDSAISEVYTINLDGHKCFKNKPLYILCKAIMMGLTSRQTISQKLESSMIYQRQRIFVKSYITEIKPFVYQ